MSRIFSLLAALGLVLTLLPACLVFTGTITLEQNRWWMTAGAVLWFGARLAGRRYFK